MNVSFLTLNEYPLNKANTVPNCGHPVKSQKRTTVDLALRWPSSPGFIIAE